MEGSALWKIEVIKYFDSPVGESIILKELRGGGRLCGNWCVDDHTKSI